MGELVLGLGGCLDHEVVWDASVLEELVRHHGIGLDELDGDVVVTTERELVVSVLALLRAGTGGERFVPAPGLVEGFAARFDRRTTLGGTAPRAAMAVARLGVPSTVHLVSIDDRVRALLPPEVSYLCSAGGDSSHPHLVLQAPAGARVRVGAGEVVVTHANRLIYVNDPPNSEMVISPRLGEVLERASVVLLSNLNAVRDVTVLRRRLEDLRRHLRRLPAGALVVFEDAGYHRREMARLVAEGLADVVDVWSMNEDEAQEVLGRRLDLADPRDVADGLAELRRALPAPVLVVHTRRFVVAVGRGADRLRRALHSGVALAGTRYLHGDGFTVDDHARVSARRPDADARRLAAAVEELLPETAACVAAPTLTTTSPTTIGLGDTFAGGLVMALSRPAAAVHVLAANQPPDRFYEGGARIASFRGGAGAGSRSPEDWLASTTPLARSAEKGLSRLPGGELLVDAVRRDPVAWLGAEHVRAFGASTELLVKLLDAGQRLPVHAHPDRAFAAAHLGSRHGKTEAWVFLAPATVHLAFTRDVERRELATWVREQDAAALLDAMHEVHARAGDVVLVPAGLPHAIGAGALLVELQEPSDLSVLMEWEGFALDGRADGHLELGFDVALGAVDRRGWSRQEVDHLVAASAETLGDLLPAAATHFRVERHRGQADLTAGYGVLVVVAGEGVMAGRAGAPVAVRQGQTVLVPHEAGPLRLHGLDLEVLRCRPPAPDGVPTSGAHPDVGAGGEAVNAGAMP